MSSAPERFIPLRSETYARVDPSTKTCTSAGRVSLSARPPWFEGRPAAPSAWWTGLRTEESRRGLGYARQRSSLRRPPVQKGFRCTCLRLKRSRFNSFVYDNDKEIKCVLEVKLL